MEAGNERVGKLVYLMDMMIISRTVMQMTIMIMNMNMNMIVIMTTITASAFVIITARSSMIVMNMPVLVLFLQPLQVP